MVQKLSPGLSELFAGFSASHILATGVEVAWIDFENGGKVGVRDRGMGVYLYSCGPGRMHMSTG